MALLANIIARSLRKVKRRWLPRFDVRSSRLAHLYLKWMSRAARLQYVDDVHGHRMYLDDKDSLGLSVARETEPAETRLVERTIEEGWTVIDIGANIGYYSLLFARAVGPTGRVIAIEPDATNFDLLRKNIALNGYQNVTLINAAVWSSTTTLKLYLSEENRGDHRAYESADPRLSVDTPALGLDEYFGSNPPPIAFIKMDVQGAECHALRGMLALLRSNTRAQIVSEFWPAGLIAAGTSPHEYLDTLHSLGYDFQEIGDLADTLTPISRDELLAKYANGGDDFTNILCKPR